MNALIAISGDGWPDDVRLSDIEPRFICQALRPSRRRRAAGFQLEQDAGQSDGLPLAAVAGALIGGRPQANE
jgi:hypothetical protein